MTPDAVAEYEDGRADYEYERRRDREYETRLEDRREE